MIFIKNAKKKEVSVNSQAGKEIRAEAATLSDPALPTIVCAAS